MDAIVDWVITLRRSLWNRVATFDSFTLPDRLVRGLVVGQYAVGAAGDGRPVDRGQPLFVFLDDSGKLGPVGEIGPLVRIVLHIVELLASVSIANVTPSFAAYSVIAPVVAGNGRTLTRGDGISQLRHEAQSFDVAARRQTTSASPMARSA